MDFLNNVLGKNHLKHKYYKNEKVFLETFGIKYDLLDRFNYQP